MAKNAKLDNNIAVRLDDETYTRIEVHQEQEQRRTISEMARILIVEALNARGNGTRRKK